MQIFTYLGNFDKTALFEFKLAVLSTHVHIRVVGKYKYLGSYLHKYIS